MQADGNFVVTEKESGRTLWSTNTADKGSGPYRLAMQKDTNLVLFDSQNEIVWKSRTNGRGKEPSRLVLKDDGDLIIYDTNDRIVWSWRSRSSLTAGVLNPDSTLLNGQTMNENECKWSPNRIFQMCLQDDGNFCIYDKAHAGGWCTYSHNRGPRPRRITMQTDNNLVEYGSDNQPVYATKTNEPASNEPAALTIQDDGNLIIYQGGQAIWSGRGGVLGNPNLGNILQNGQTMFEDDCLQSPNKQWQACFQSDGSLDTYQNGVSKWWNGFSNIGFRPRRLVLQADNNLVQYDAKNQALWMTNTNGKSTAPATLSMQDDGNLVMYAGGKVLWSSAGEAWGGR